MSLFRLVAPFSPTGDQPTAIAELVREARRGSRWQTLLGVTGSGKTFTIASAIAELERPALVFSHNKTLAAQLYGELKGFFPDNAIEYYISYYDYYQPEAFIPATNTYIEKDTSINDEIERLRLRATSSLLSRRDVIVVASVSAIYGVGNPRTFKEGIIGLRVGLELDRDELLAKLVAIQYHRNDLEADYGTFRVRGDSVEIRSGFDDKILRVEFFGDEIEQLTWVEPLTGRTREKVGGAAIYPATQFVLGQGGVGPVIDAIGRDLEVRLGEFDRDGRNLEAQRLASRCRYDMEMIQQLGHCPGVENYSRYFDGRNEGERPACLLDYFPEDYLMVIDESHATIPQIGAMYQGDRSRKQNLVEHGFRLPSALDNRPLTFAEFEAVTPQTIFVSATPGDYELEKSGGVVVEQVIRPTGLIDPPITVLPVKFQVDDLIERIGKVTARGERVLVTTLTKKMSEDLTGYLAAAGIKVCYLHSDIMALDRIEILRNLRLGKSDVLVGVNLLREGLDFPEVSLVAILDADREGFLRSERSLIQTSGRAARNLNGEVIMYADRITRSMRRAIDETDRRRKRQIAWNKEHNITPRTVTKSREEIIMSTSAAGGRGLQEDVVDNKPWEAVLREDLSPRELVHWLEREMLAAAGNLEFEKAATLRDRLDDLKAQWGIGTED
ncbi:excinuclease ABC subunit UvrB [bacterium]|nr:excinuclease ABC subunit UvrB [bacterium]PJA76199.1 MAG: excinuclease ABC subunit B [bacterium CG_4_9_14_3_um_filter_65_15]